MGRAHEQWALVTSALVYTCSAGLFLFFLFLAKHWSGVRLTCQPAPTPLELPLYSGASLCGHFVIADSFSQSQTQTGSESLPL